MTAANDAVSTEHPPAVTFDTLAAAQELRGAGLDNRQAEAIVTTVNKAMSETLATKSDLQLHSAEMKAALELQGTEIRAEMELLRTDLKGDMKLLEQSMAALQNKIVLQLGGLMVTLTFLLLAVGPFYIRWALSLFAA